MPDARHVTTEKMTSPEIGHCGQNALLLLSNYSKSDILPPLALGSTRSKR
jgi:hypothetical protein